MSERGAAGSRASDPAKARLNRRRRADEMVGPTKGRWSRELAAGIFAVVALHVQGVGYIPVMELVDLPDFGPDEYDEIVDGEEDPFGTEHLGIEWCPKDCHVGLEDDGRLVAHAGWLTTDARMANGELIEVLGLGGVMLHRRYRGSGVGRLVVTGAMDRMRRQSAVIAMLFCRPERLRFYGDLGWFPITEPVTVGQPGGSIVMPLRTCWLPLTQGTILPVGAIEFPGLPF